MHDSPEQPEVLVIGAGPAGAMAALLLARQGVAVTLVDKAHWPREKVCGCCLNATALAALDAAGLSDLPGRCGARPLRSLRLAAGSRRATIALPRSVALSRRTLDAALVDAAVDAGATFRAQTTAKVADAGGPIVELNGEPARPRVVVVADGLAGRAMNEPSTPVADSRIGAAAILDGAPPSYGAGAIHMAIGRGGYVGLVRLEDGRLDVAAAFDADAVRLCGSPGLAAAHVLDECGLAAIDGLDTAAWRGTAMLTRRRAGVADGGVFFVGDAAGYVEPFTGEGIGWAMVSAAALAPIVARAVGGDVRAAESWRREHHRLLAARHRRCRIVARLLRWPLAARWAVAAIGAMPMIGRPLARRFAGGGARPTVAALAANVDAATRSTL